MKAVDGVSFDLREGEVLGLVGESGSGKTTLGRALLGLVRPTGGSVKLRGEELVGLPERELRPKRRHLQMVFQDPHASLNPGMTLETALAHPLQIHKLTKGDAETQAKVRETLELVGLVARRAVRRPSFPSDLSGGQKQRAAIARAIILGPDLLVADEPVSMLDMSVRAKILDLMIDLKHAARADVRLRHARPGRRRSSSATAWRSCTSAGSSRSGPSTQIFDDPKHPYTQALIRAIPEPDPDKALPRDLPRGEIPDAARAAARLLVPPALPEGVRASAAGRAATCARSSRSAGSTAGEETYADRAPAGRRPREARRSASTRRSCPAGSGKDPGELLAMLERIRAEEPDEPLWKGVQGDDAPRRTACA